MAFKHLWLAISIFLDLTACTTFHCDSSDQDCLQNREVYSAMPPARRKQCKESVLRGRFKDYKECSWALSDPDDYACRSEKSNPDSYKECVWEINNPVEAKCKREAKEEDYWKCVQITKEADDRQKDRALFRDMHEDQMQAARQDRNREIWRGVGQSFQSQPQPQQPQTKCTTRRMFNGDIETVCH